MESLQRYRWVMLSLAFLTSLVMHLLLFSYAPLVSKIIAEMNLTHAQAGFIFSISVLTIVILRIPWGLLCDHLGFRTSTGLAATLMGVFGLLRGFATSYETLLAFQVLLGVGLAAIVPSLTKLVSNWFPPEKAGLATGVYVAGFSIGDILALSLTPYVLSLLGSWRSVLNFYGLWAIAFAAVWWAMARNPPKNEATPTHEAHSRTKLKEDFQKLVRMRKVWLLTLLYICAAGCYDTTCTWLPYMLEAREIPPPTAGLVASMLPLGLLVGAPIIGILSDRVGLRKPFILILGAISGPAIYLTGIVEGPLLWVTTFVAGFGTMGVLTLALTIPIERREISSVAGSVVGLISSVGNVGSLVMPTAVGQIKDTMGSFLPATLMLAIIAEGMLFLGLMLKEKN